MIQQKESQTAILYGALLVDLGRELELFTSLLPETEESRGGCFCLLGSVNPRAPLLIATFGTQIPERRERSFLFCQEKAARLLSRASAGDVSSWQSRDEKMGRYGGAVLYRGTAFSFSGLPEQADEAVMLHVLRDAENWGMPRPQESYLRQIAQISGNMSFRSS